MISKDVTRRSASLLLAILSLIQGRQLLCQTARELPSIHFYQLTTAQGLSDNYIQHLTIDKSGNLWIGTGEGLNMFNGKSVIKYFPDEYPQMQSSNVRQIECDPSNRIWLLTGEGYGTLIDEHRRFHKIALWKEGKRIPIRRILQMKSKGVVLFTSNAHYAFNGEANIEKLDSLTVRNFNSFAIKGFEEIQKKGFRQVEPLEDDRMFFSFDDQFFITDYKSDTLAGSYPIPHIVMLCNWSKNEILICDREQKRLGIFHLRIGTISFPFDHLRDQHGLPIQGNFTNAEQITSNKFAITAHRNGLYIYDWATQSLYNHMHDASDPSSIVNNTPESIAVDSNGWVFIGATPNGISYFNSNAVIGNQSVFTDHAGNIYDGYINNIATADNRHYYIGVHDNLIMWDRETNTSRFLHRANNNSAFANFEVNYVTFDNQQRLWASVPLKGICIYDKELHLIKYLDQTKPEYKYLNENRIRHMVVGPDGYMWLSTREGLFKVNTQNFAIEKPSGKGFDQLDSHVINRVWFQDKDHVWISTGNKGAWRIHMPTGDFTVHNMSNGLISNDIFEINRDKDGNIYIGTDLGLDILLADGGKKRITKKDGLLNSRIEALLLDKKNRMWIGNDVALACFNIADSTLKLFDERYGLSIQGFRINAYHQNNDDELIWGTERGLQYFYPDDLYDQEIKLKTTVHRIESRDFLTDLSTSEQFELNPGNNFVTFYFSTIDYSTHLHTFYQYKLEGLDRNWNTTTSQNAVRYNSLDPGHYVFKVRASNDKKIWIPAENEIFLYKASYFWDSIWFQLLIIGGILGAAISLLQILNSKQKRRTEELETEVVINYFASRINTHQTTEELYWDVAKNCISRLKFEDCVIYHVDKSRGVLVQKAAYGPKSGNDQTIHQPIDIPIGEGIVGYVARTGKAELVRDTTRDPRYIIDDMARQSEIAVPITMDGSVIGVIDSEHPQKNFFTQKHLAILTTISVLCVNQLQRNKAEEEKQQAKIEVWENKQKAAESRLQSLRLQMNPHFLFNALNSIQQMILANEEMVATRYLSRFSKLLRSILIHSDKESISLKEEIEILRLYVELESVRFKDAFTYEIKCDEDIDTDEVKIPTLLIQPFVENAIWHGLMHKEGKRNLRIEFTDQHDHVQCVVEDNGIGREKSATLKLSGGNGNSHTSKGIKVSVERLQAMQKNGGPRGSLQITDLKDDNGLPLGTRVQINLPIQN